MTIPRIRLFHRRRRHRHRRHCSCPSIRDPQHESDDCRSCREDAVVACVVAIPCARTNKRMGWNSTNHVFLIEFKRERTRFERRVRVNRRSALAEKKLFSPRYDSSPKTHWCGIQWGKIFLQLNLAFAPPSQPAHDRSVCTFRGPFCQPRHCSDTNTCCLCPPQAVPPQVVECKPRPVCPFRRPMSFHSP
jgi:hypothetical protein